MADPRRLAFDGWFTADRLEIRASGGMHPDAVDRDVLERAGQLTQRARDLKGATDRVSLERVGHLHVLAAELKRLNGAERECLVDYVALSELFLGQGEIGAAIAYMRKALYVADLPPEQVDIPPGQVDIPPERTHLLAWRAGRMRARLLAARAYVTAWQGGKAVEAAEQAAAIAEDLGDPAALAEAERLRKAGEDCRGGLSHRRCPCGKGVPYLQCCGPADEMPEEFSVRLYHTRAMREASPHWSRGAWGLELLMAPPGSEGDEPRSFYAWRVEAGRHRLLAYPNLTGRALAAARKMADLAGRDGEGSEAASCAILQAVGALEAFMTAWKLFMRKQVEDPHWPGKDPAGRGANSQTRMAETWIRMGKAMFRDAWRCPEADMADMRALVKLRIAIVHSIGDAEQIVPRLAEPNEHVAHLLQRELRLKPAPAPWVDRVLTPSVATWAVLVATTQIAYVRSLYDARSREAEKADIAAMLDGIDADIKEELRLQASA